MSNQVSQAEIDQLIADEFGANASYVSDLLHQFEQNPASVDQEWREYFDELIRNGNASTQPERVLATGDGGPGAAPEAAAPPSSRDLSQHVLMRGAALRLAENMESSLGVPTATSQREIPL